MMRVAVSTAERRLAPAAPAGRLQVLDEFLFFASSSKGLVPKDHAEVCAIARAVILTRVTGRNGYPDHYDQALAFSATLYPASRGLLLRSAFLNSKS
jgi:hypothetical protein